MAGIGVVLNPKSSRNRRNPRAASRLARILGDQGVVREAHSVEELRRIAEDFRKLSIDVLAIAGGDGTNHVTLTGFLAVYGDEPLPKLALLRGGTMNTVANSIGVRRGRPESLLEGLTRRSRGDSTHRHVLHIGDTSGFLFGTGAVYGFLAEYYRNGQPTPLIAAKTLIEGVGSALVGGDVVARIAAPFRGTVTLPDGTRWETRDYLAVAGGGVDQIGLHFRPFRRFAETPGCFHLLGIHTNPMGFVADLPRIWRAMPMRPGKTYEAVVPSAILEAEEGVVRYMVDGDLHEQKGPLHVRTGPSLELLLGY
ncbi:MAG TPA: diacylglycerol kinase family protein [Polyangiaceae bacterium]